MAAMIALLVMLVLGMPIVTLLSLLVLRARLNERLDRIEERLHRLSWPDPPREEAAAPPVEAAPAPPSAPEAIDRGTAFAWPEAPARVIEIGTDDEEAEPEPRESFGILFER